MKISIITPVFNESEVIEMFLESLHRELDKTAEDFEVICVNDGSTDDSLLLLKQCKTKYTKLRVINLSRNFGKESALTAGVENAVGDVVIPMDADLQDPPELIHSMLTEYKAGYDVVLARRSSRKHDVFLKKITASLFYRFMSRISKLDIHENVGDFRLMSYRVVDTLKQLKETQRFMKGIFSWPGFSTTIIDYERSERAAGNTSFNMWALWNLAVEGITSFSVAPLKAGIFIGIFVSICSFLYALFTIFKTLVLGIDVPGYASLIVIILFMNGVQFLFLGILGEYVGRIYMETKHRPVYIIEDEY